jgi:hypothetical protein
LRLFVLSAALDDAQGCKMAIESQTFGGGYWAKSPLGKVRVDSACDRVVTGGLNFDVTSWSTHEFSRLPIRYTVALAQAGRFIDRCDGKETDWQKVADEFYRIVTG